MVLQVLPPIIAEPVVHPRLQTEQHPVLRHMKENQQALLKTEVPMYSHRKDRYIPGQAVHIQARADLHIQILMQVQAGVQVAHLHHTADQAAPHQHTVDQAVHIAVPATQADLHHLHTVQEVAAEAQAAIVQEAAEVIPPEVLPTALEAAADQADIPAVEVHHHHRIRPVDGDNCPFIIC